MNSNFKGWILLFLLTVSANGSSSPQLGALAQNTQILPGSFDCSIQFYAWLLLASTFLCLGLIKYYKI